MSLKMIGYLVLAGISINAFSDEEIAPYSLLDMDPEFFKKFEYCGIYFGDGREPTLRSKTTMTEGEQYMKVVMMEDVYSVYSLKGSRIKFSHSFGRSNKLLRSEYGSDVCGYKYKGNGQLEKRACHGKSGEFEEVLTYNNQTLT